MSDWKDAVKYYFGKTKVLVLKADKDVPVRFYIEVHVDNIYQHSMGSNVPFKWLAALIGFLSVKVR